MKISRRQFLTLTIAAMGTGTGLALGIRQLRESDALFDNNTVGALDEATIAALVALAAAYVGSYGSVSHYRTYFVWRAENLPGYLHTYQVFAPALDAAAQQISGSPFAEADAITQKDIIRYTLELPEPESGLFDPVFREPPISSPLTFEEQLWQRFHRMVLGELITVFLNTNAWIMLGYDSWPSQPRGLEKYTEPIEAKTEGTANGP
jgi:hypothetical protein